MTSAIFTTLRHTKIRDPSLELNFQEYILPGNAIRMELDHVHRPKGAKA